VIRVSSFRYFNVVTPVPRYLRLAFVAALVLGLAMLWLDPMEVDSALGSILLLQMCAASAGYTTAARRGWFDPLLVSGRDRRAIALANLAAAAWPGAAAWLLLASFEAILTHGHWPAALALHRVAALALATSIAWAGGLGLPRTAAAMLWLALLLALASTRMFLPRLVSLQSPPHGPIEIGSAALACTVCPFLLADAAAVRDVAVVSCVIAVSIACAAAGTIWIASRDWPLVCLP
jgi:hypothetical protein